MWFLSQWLRALCGELSEPFGCGELTTAEDAECRRGREMDPIESQAACEPSRTLGPGELPGVGRRFPLRDLRALCGELSAFLGVSDECLPQRAETWFSQSVDSGTRELLGWGRFPLRDLCALCGELWPSESLGRELTTAEDAARYGMSDVRPRGPSQSFAISTAR